MFLLRPIDVKRLRNQVYVNSTASKHQANLASDASD